MSAALSADPSPKWLQSSVTISRRRRMRRISALPERLEADAAQRINEALAVRAQLAVALDDALEGGRHLVLRHRWADDLTEGGEAVGRAAEADLVPLLAVLVDAEDADVADVMVPAGVHAA